MLDVPPLAAGRRSETSSVTVIDVADDKFWCHHDTRIFRTSNCKLERRKISSVGIFQAFKTLFLFTRRYLMTFSYCLTKKLGGLSVSTLPSQSRKESDILLYWELLGLQMTN